MQPRPVANPPNPWHPTVVDYLDGDPPTTTIHVYEDHTRNILASNDSPDVGFNWSVNPYRGCLHSCSYCLFGDTPILLADGSTCPIQDLAVGDEIYGTVRQGFYRRYVRTRVLDHWRVEKEAYRVRLADGTELITSGDHRFLTSRGWKFVTDSERGLTQRPHLTTGVKLMGVGKFATPPEDTPDYRRGYLCGLIRGDGAIGRYTYDRGNGRHWTSHKFRLALIDLEALRRARNCLDDLNIRTRASLFQEAVGNFAPLFAIGTQTRSNVDRIREIIAWPADAGLDWSKGFLAGIFDAEGSRSQHVLRFSNMDPEILAHIRQCLDRLGFDHVLEDQRRVANVRVRGGLFEHLRFFHTVDPAISRKRDFEGEAVKSSAPLDVVSVEPLGLTMPLHDITTGTGDFIANGVVSHNCYARPTHEYLGFGAGTDFDTRIVIKPHAAELLREAFDKKSWKGELVMFSGVTDCYQPLEATYKLTRGCLEVCAEYRNPVSIITKAPLIERDIDVLKELAKVTRAHVSMSIPFWDPERARAIEPWVATPQRRIKALERLAKAGISVGVMVAPIIPGLNDEDMPRVLEAARGAGATHAGFVLLRLPGSVKAVFEERVRTAFPLRAEKILNRIRETRGGKLYDSRFGHRQVGEGEYAEMIGTLFEMQKRRLGYPEWRHDDDGPSTFKRPPPRKGQLGLF